MQDPRVVANFCHYAKLSGIVPCADGTNDYIVVFKDVNRVKRISGVDHRDGDGKERWAVGSKGSGIDAFRRPSGVVVLPGGQAVVADRDNSRLQVLDIATGKFIRR